MQAGRTGMLMDIPEERFQQRAVLSLAQDTSIEASEKNSTSHTHLCVPREARPREHRRSKARETSSMASEIGSRAYRKGEPEAGRVETGEQGRGGRHGGEARGGRGRGALRNTCRNQRQNASGLLACVWAGVQYVCTCVFVCVCVSVCVCVCVCVRVF